MQRASGRNALTSTWLAAMGGAAATAFAPFSHAQQTIRTVAKLGDPIPGYPGRVFDVIGVPAISSSGRVVFDASSLAAPFVGGVFVENADLTPRLLINAGEPAPGIAGATIWDSSFGGLNEVGQVVFTAVLQGVSANHRAIYVGTPENVRLLVRAGQAWPAPEVGSFGSLGADPFRGPVPMIDGAGMVLFRDADNAQGSTGLWTARLIDDVPVLGLVARGGAPAPGVPGARFWQPIGTAFEYGTGRLSPSGQVVFGSHLYAVGGGWATPRTGVWLGSTSEPQLVIASGMDAPGTSGASLQEIQPAVASNAAGQIAIWSTLSGAGVTTENDEGVWAGVPAGLRLVARAGDIAPGVGGARFSQFRPLSLSGQGRVAFVGVLTGSGVTVENNTGIWSEATGGLRLVARQAAAAPGPSGRFFESLHPHHPSINSLGHTVFQARTYDMFGEYSGRGVWATDLQGNLFGVAVSGGVFDIEPSPDVGDFRVVVEAESWFGTGCQDGLPSGLNDRGELVLRVSYLGPAGTSDGSGTGVFVVTLPRCRADFNGVGGVTLQDIFDFLGAWFGFDPRSDYNGDGDTSLQDLFDFLALWFAGCP
ncbi:MAG: hypothetical protein IT438_07315 [Phycisphaerales bacterium]|nr:hypothetical protein [Phycisphaerales bacterium]